MATFKVRLHYSCLIMFLALMAGLPVTTHAGVSFTDYAWSRVNDGSGTIWSRRAGLQAVRLGDRFYVMGGRTPKPDALTFGDSVFHNDVWMSEDEGYTWTRLADAPWAARAYFQAVVLDGYIYVIGGQDSTAVPYFDYPLCENTPGLPADGIPCPEYTLASNFFNDVWRSDDGSNWTRMSAADRLRGWRVIRTRSSSTALVICADL